METKLLNPLTLAFMGDGIYELLAREQVINAHGSLSPEKLHRMTVELVRASAQAEAYERLLPYLTPEEVLIYKRGRNSNAVSVPKNASPAQYRSATGLETLFGWHFLSGNHDRVAEMFRLANGELINDEAEPARHVDGCQGVL